MNRGLNPLLTWTTSRNSTSLNGEWRSIIDVYDVGVGGPFGDDTMLNPMWGYPMDRGRHSPGRRAEYDFDTSPVLQVPGDWNTQIERCHYYEGSMWFRKRFPTPSTENRRTVLYLGAANYATTVFLNGERLGDHEGGYGPFCVELTGKMNDTGDNSLIIRVDNRRTREAIPTTRTDWFNYGGITRDVILVDLPATYIVDAVVQLSPSNPTLIDVTVALDGPRAEQEVTVTIDGSLLGSLRTGANGVGTATFAAPNDLALWSPTDPALHDVVVTAVTDEVSDRIGFRSIRAEGSQILLNGEPVFLAGISVHDEAMGPEPHRISTVEEAREVLGHAKALGCNFVRLAHYQHNEFTVRACDELGLMAWCEVPVYWKIHWDNPDTEANAVAQLTELIVRDRNRAAVVLWSIANETPPEPSRSRFLAHLAATARGLDPTRLITAALFAHPRDGDHLSAMASDIGSEWVIDDPLGEHLDVLGVNEYHGWYYGTFETMETTTWTTPYDKPLIISEFGADARAGLRGEPTESWTEDLQAAVYRHQFDMQAKIPFLAGVSPWILKDFRAPFRLLPGVQDGFNRKGLIDLTGVRKLAFDVVAEHHRGRLAGSSTAVPASSIAGQSS